MFRATIEEAGLLDEWFEFKREALRGIARETLEELNMPYKGSRPTAQGERTVDSRVTSRRGPEKSGDLFAGAAPNRTSRRTPAGHR